MGSGEWTRTNPNKVEMMVFTRKRRWDNLNIRPLQSKEKVKYPGVWLDSKLTFEEHISVKTGAACNAFWACRRALEATWGLGPKNIAWIYDAMVAPMLMHRSVVWWTGSTRTGSRLDKVQRLTYLCTTGSMKKAPTRILEALVGMQPLADRVAVFRNLSDDVSLESIEIPESPENRRPTNVKWLIILGVILLVWLAFTSYTVYYSDISRFTVGYDECGNACGKKNYKWEGIDCSGQDFTNLPYLEIGRHSIIQGKRCVQSCKEGYTEIFGRCLRNTLKDDEEVDPNEYVYVSRAIWPLANSCMLSIIVTIGMLFLFRYAGAFMVWGILIGTLLLLLVLAVGSWFIYRGDPRMEILAWGIFFTGLLVIFVILFIWSLKRIPLVILLLKETSQAVCDMPGLIAIPVFSGLAIVIVTFIFFIIYAYCKSAGTLQKTMNESYTYVRNSVMIFTMVYNVWTYLLLWEFFIDIEYMIIAGAVAKWYFARDKRFLGSPILTSMSIAFKFHLGTVAMGAIIISIIWIIKRLIRSKKYDDGSCFSCVTDILKYLSRNAYIVTVLHGQAFLKSGKRAAKLLFYNFGDMVALNFISWWVVFVARVLSVIVSVLLSVVVFAVAPGPSTISHKVSYFVVLVFAWLFAKITFDVFETGIDTIFICYCEDKLMNDGIARPYFMSRNLMEFIQKSQAAYGIQ